MTILERIKIARESNEAWKDEDTLNKLIALAYEIGRESAAKEISDDYTELIADMRKRADAWLTQSLVIRTISTIICMPETLLKPSALTKPTFERRQINDHHPYP